MNKDNAAKLAAKKLVLSYRKTIAGKRLANLSPTRWDHIAGAPHLPLLRRWERQIGDIMTPRKLEVMYALASGLDQKEAAEALHVTTKTIRYHLTDIYKSLGINKQHQLIAYIYKNLPTKADKKHELLGKI